MDTNVLMQLGLNESEVKVYFALLELESSSVGRIYEKAGVADSKIYAILDKLKEKGLVSFIVKNNVKHFQASSPRNLLRLLNEREAEIREQKKELKEKIIPEIEQRRKLTEEKQEAIVFEGFEGLRSAFDLILESLRKGEEYQVFMLGEDLGEERVVRFFENYHKKRIEKGVKVRFVADIGIKGIVQKHHQHKGMRIRFTNQKFPLGTFIFKGNVMAVVWGEKPAAFLIRSERSYKAYLDFFEDVWGKAR